MSIGLDLGTSRFRSLRRQDRRLIARQTPTAYAAVEATTDHARLLNQIRIPVIRSDAAFLVSGPDAESFAAAFSRPLIPLFVEGQLPEADPIARQVVAERLGSVIEHQGREARAGCSVVLPRDAVAGSATHDYLLRLVTLQGYAPQPISTAQAVGLAELSTSGFAGVVLSFGASCASLALIERGQIGTLVEVPCGGDWIDRTIAEETGLCLHDRDGLRYFDTVGSARWKQAPDRQLNTPTDATSAVLLRCYTEVLTSLLGRFQRALVREGMNGVRRTALPIICHGGCTRINGFLTLFSRLWQQAEIDLSIGASRLSQDDNWTVARGCLIHSEVAVDSRRQFAA
jgi:hypothetical protein